MFESHLCYVRKQHIRHIDPQTHLLECLKRLSSLSCLQSNFAPSPGKSKRNTCLCTGWLCSSEPLTLSRGDILRTLAVCDGNLHLVFCKYFLSTLHNISSLPFLSHSPQRLLVFLEYIKFISLYSTVDSFDSPFQAEPTEFLCWFLSKAKRVFFDHPCFANFRCFEGN